MNVHNLLLQELTVRKNREEKILLDSGGIKNYDDYKYCVGKVHAIKEIMNLIEEHKKKC